MTDFTPGDGREFRPPTKDEFDFRIESQVGYVDVAGSSSTATVNDAVVLTTTADYSDPYYDTGIIGAEGVTLQALDATGVLTDKRVTRVSNGPCRILASHPWLSKSVSVDMTRINDNVYTSLDSYVSGSLAKHIDDQTKALIGSHTVADMPIYSTQNHAGATYVRNVDCWASSIDLTAISPWNSRGAQYRAGTAITPRHVILAKHYPLSVSDTVRFVTAGNVVVDRTVEAIYGVPESKAYDKDIQVVKLNADLPASITPVKFLPANAYSYLPSWKQWKIPLIYTNQQEKICCALATAGTVSPVDWIGAWVTTESPYATMYERVISGDSGSPAFFVINGQLVLLCTWTLAGQGPAHHKMLTEIVLALTTLGGGHTLQTVDLSSFPSYA